MGAAWIDKVIIQDFGPTGISGGIEISNNIVFPNPSTGKITVAGSGPYEVLDMYGRTIKKGIVTGSQLLELNKGQYIIKTGGKTFRQIIL